jgi:hypothetical protein
MESTSQVSELERLESLRDVLCFFFSLFSLLWGNELMWWSEKPRIRDGTGQHKNPSPFHRVPASAMLVPTIPSCKTTIRVHLARVSFLSLFRRLAGMVEDVH